MNLRFIVITISAFTLFSLVRAAETIPLTPSSTLSLEKLEVHSTSDDIKDPSTALDSLSSSKKPLISSTATQAEESSQARTKTLATNNTPSPIIEQSKTVTQPFSPVNSQEPEISQNQKKEAVSLPTNALSRLRAARTKYQGVKNPAEALNKADGSSQRETPTSLPASNSEVSSVSITSSPHQTPLPASLSSQNLEETISLQFPHTSIMEVLALYEKLTGKHIIRDSTLYGPGAELSIIVADPVPKKEAINMIESSMLLNGYVVVPVDEKTVKVLSSSRPPRTEGLPLYLEESQIPIEGDQFVSFYQPLHFLSTTEAINILQGVVQLNNFGTLVAVPNTSALVITDTTPIIRKALALLKVIDHESSQIITEFVPLQRADAQKTVETLNQIFGKESAATPTTVKGPAQGSGPNNPNGPNNQTLPQVADTSNPGDERVFSGKVQFIADKRTNRILVVTRTENYRYVRELIANLDQAQAPEEPLVRPLNYMSASDVFPVLVDMLKNKDDDTTQNQSKAQQQTPQNPFNNNNNSGGLLGSQNPLDGSSSGVNAGGSHADRLNESTKQSPPQSAIVGSTSIVADPTANSIIVYGPPESKTKANQIIDLLDRRPQQVYLAAVIGQMKLGEGMEYGASYLFHYQGFNSLANTFGGPAAGALLNGINSTFPGAGGTTGNVTSPFANANGVNNTVNNSEGGLTVFGSIGGSIDTYAKFLENTGKFKTIARPTVYTSNNKKATILSGTRIPYQSQTLSSVVNNSAASTSNNQTANSITANVTYQDVLLKLEVIPLINSDKEVNLIIAQQNQSVDSTATTRLFKAGINAPVVNTQELTTSVRITSGSTIVLGGLITEEKTNDEKGIPYINKIPILGPLLGGSTKNTKERSELVVMIQPIVIDSNDAMQKASDQQGGTSDLGTEAKNLVNKLQPSPPPPAPKKKKFKLFGMPKMNNY